MKTVPLRRVADVVSGQSPPSDQVIELVDGLPFVQGNAEFTEKSPAPRLQCDTAPKVARRGDLLLSVRAPVGAINWCAGDLGIGRGVAALRPGGNWDSRFLAYGIKARLSDLKALAAGSTFDAVTAEALGALLLPVTDPEQQRRIADFLDDRVGRIDRIIAARREQMAAANETFMAQRSAVVLGTASLSCQDTELPWAPRVGKGWRVRRLSQLARIGTGHTPSRSVQEFWIDCHIPWLTTSDVHRFRKDEIDDIDDTAFHISELGLANSAAVVHPRQTVALSRTASAGFSILMRRAMATSQDFVTWTCGPELMPEFLLASLRVMRPFLLGYLATGSTHKTIYFPDLMDLRVAVPEVAAQRAAVVQVEADAARRANVADAMNRQVDLLTEYKQSLITAAVTGDLDVAVAGRGVST